MMAELIVYMMQGGQMQIFPQSIMILTVPLTAVQITGSLFQQGVEETIYFAMGLQF